MRIVASSVCFATKSSKIMFHFRKISNAESVSRGASRAQTESYTKRCQKVRQLFSCSTELTELRELEGGGAGTSERTNETQIRLIRPRNKSSLAFYTDESAEGIFDKLDE